MRAFCLITVTLFLPWAAIDAGPVQMAVLQRDIYVPDTGTGPLPLLRASQVLPCLHVSTEGFHVVCRDAKGTARVGLLPKRDEWGHVSASDWTHDDTLSGGTVRVRFALPMKPGSIRLAAGDKWPVLRADDTSCTLGFAVGGLVREINVANADVVIETPPRKSAEQVRLERLETRLSTVTKRRDELQEQFAALDAANARMHEMVLEMRDAEMETARLRVQVDAARRKQDMLLAHKPADSDAVKEEARKLLNAVKQQEKTAIRLAKAELLGGDLKTLHEELDRTEERIQEAKVRLTRAHAELAVLEKQLQDTQAAEEQAALRADIVKAERQVAFRTENLKHETTKRDRLATLTAQIEALRAKSQQLAEQIRAIAEEIAQLRAGGEPQAPEPAPAPAPEPAPEPAPAPAPAP